MKNIRDSLISFDQGVWLAWEPVKILCMQLTATMTVLRLTDGSLLIYSPISLTPARRKAIEGIGPVAHLYAPNLYHHLRMGEWVAAFPSAKLHGPRGLSEKRRDLSIDRIHGELCEPAFAGVVDERAIGGFRLMETVLVYRPARVLVVADLIHNIGRPPHLWSQFYSRMMGFYDRAAISRMIRWTCFPDKTAARRSLDELLALPFEKIIVGHGEPITAGGKQAIAAAFQWLPEINN